MADFIFMLTRADRTIADAEARLQEVIDAGATHIGFKDIGLPLPQLRSLAAAIRVSRARLYLEVVSLDAESEAASARAAVELGVDVLMGGVRPATVLPILAGSGMRYYPFAGDIVGHPSVLSGSIARIVESASRLLDHNGVHGLDLLAYRSRENVPELMRCVCAVAGERPVVVAGSLDCAERICASIAAGAAAFTVGTAALDGVFPGSPQLADQLRFIHGVRETALAARRPGIDQSAIPTTTEIM